MTSLPAGSGHGRVDTGELRRRAEIRQRLYDRRHSDEQYDGWIATVALDVEWLLNRLDAAREPEQRVRAMCDRADHIDATSCEPDGGGWATTDEIRDALDGTS